MASFRFTLNGQHNFYDKVTLRNWNVISTLAQYALQWQRHAWMELTATLWRPVNIYKSTGIQTLHALIKRHVLLLMSKQAGLLIISQLNK